MDLFSIFASYMTYVWYALPVLLLVLFFKSPWFKGFFGEFLVNRMLSRLPGNEYTLLKNITLPTEDGTTQIDHVLVSEFGIFVLETKNMKGWIFGSTQQKQWTQKIYRHTSKFQNPLHQNYKHTKTLESVLNMSPEHIHSLIVFVGDGTFKTEMPPNVTYCRGGLEFIRSFTQRVLSRQDVIEAIALLEEIKLKPGLATALKHKKHVRNIVAGKAAEPACPRCGAGMLLRESKRGANAGEPFWGCSQFPKCRAVVKPTR
ncbi:nuclease-related domain-containing protein [Oceanimonas doudoroffii]|uniref:Nuclease n=1 Tax=Oceanimonas doudoroffii TaxID=84158 RepID=A0A233RG80_9GAMM|nr:NERD domain-containing protein [Oceanimonas doudoroffii]OXY82396.1 nuclease [Oceanimonas doudoroffii]